MSDQPREFDCIDCGMHVVSWGPMVANDQDLCVTCAWLRTVADETERRRLRTFLKREPKE
jgi:hypothetical protein